MAFRQKLYETLNTVGKGTRASRIYNIIMVVLILVNLSTLIFVDDDMLLHYGSGPVNPVIFAFQIINIVTVVIFILDYILRWVTSDLYLKKGRKSFIIYPFTPMAIIDLLSIIPSLLLAGNGLQILRGIRALRLLRVFSLIRHSRGVLELVAALKRVKIPLISVVLFVLVYIVIWALILFSIEPQSFDYSFFNTLYWSTVSITSTCYNEFVPQTVIGETMTMISGLIGVVVIALPVSIITAGYMLEITKFYGKKSSGITEDEDVKEIEEEIEEEIDEEEKEAEEKRKHKAQSSNSADKKKIRQKQVTCLPFFSFLTARYIPSLLIMIDTNGISGRTHS